MARSGHQPLDHRQPAAGSPGVKISLGAAASISSSLGPGEVLEQLRPRCIVDDDEAVRNALRLLIRSVGLQAQAYASARIPRRLRRVTRLPRMDVRMPGMSGWSCNRN
jgi:hypothetical protein